MMSKPSLVLLGVNAWPNVVVTNVLVLLVQDVTMEDMKTRVVVMTVTLVAMAVVVPGMETVTLATLQITLSPRVQVTVHAKMATTAIQEFAHLATLVAKSVVEDRIQNALLAITLLF